MTAAVATRWIDDGAADTILRFVRASGLGVVPSDAFVAADPQAVAS